MFGIIHMMEMEYQICGQIAHGHHFGVLCCRPCIEFYRRSVTQQKEYKCLRTGNCGIFKNGLIRKCKACRFKQCQKVGMHIGGKSGKSIELESASSSAEIVEISNEFSLLSMLKNAYEHFLTLRNSANSMRNLNPNIFGKVENLRRFEQSIKPMIVQMFEKCFKIFAKMEIEDKFPLVEKCLSQINFLADCQQTLKHFPSGDDARFFVVPGMVVDMVKFNWENRGNDMESQLIQRRFNMVQQFKNMSYSYSIENVDISVMATMFLINNADGPIWELYKKEILMEWHQHKTMEFSNADTASIQIGRLLSLLAQLDMMILKESIGLNVILPAKFRSNLFNQQPEAAGQHFISHFGCLLKCHKQIWIHFYAFNEEYLNKFERFDDLVADSSENILTISGTFSIDLMEKGANFYAGADNFWGLLYKDSNVWMLTTLGLLKSMPAFRKIDIQDKILMAQHIRPAMEIFIKSFYSAELGAQTWMRPEGLTSLWALKMVNKNFGEDKCLMQIADKCFTQPVQRFHNLQTMLSQEEFALLLAILASNTSISDLSEYAREQFYADQNIYSRILLQHLQTNLGMERGAKRFSECLFLMEGTFAAFENGEILKVYIEAFHGPTPKLKGMADLKFLRQN